MAQVSIILPTFNRERFLTEAFHAIAAQTYTDWELIVIDDGSTDNTESLVKALTPELTGQVQYIKQANGGVASARNKGLDLAQTPFIAFFDSDDLWLPHHLADCVQALQANTDVDWVFGAGRHLDMTTGQIIKEDSFRPDGNERGFLKLNKRVVGPLNIIEDPKAISLTIAHNQFGGLQASVYRQRAFENRRFPDARIGEDLAIAVSLLASGAKCAYLDNVHVLYRVHGQQTSTAAGDSIALHKRIEAQQNYTKVIGDMMGISGLSEQHQQAVRDRYINELFWKLGYHLLWNQGKAAQGLKAMRQALAVAPGNFKLWRSCVIAHGKYILGQTPKPQTPKKAAD